MSGVRQVSLKKFDAYALRYTIALNVLVVGCLHGKRSLELRGSGLRDWTQNRSGLSCRAYRRLQMFEVGGIIGAVARARCLRELG